MSRATFCGQRFSKAQVAEYKNEAYGQQNSKDTTPAHGIGKQSANNRSCDRGDAIHSPNDGHGTYQFAPRIEVGSYGATEDKST